jgi:hypothetical protein
LAGAAFAAVALLALTALAVPLVVESGFEEGFAFFLGAVFFGLRTAFMQAVALCL